MRAALDRMRDAVRKRRGSRRGSRRDRGAPGRVTGLASAPGRTRGAGRERRGRAAAVRRTGVRLDVSRPSAAVGTPLRGVAPPPGRRTPPSRCGGTARGATAGLRCAARRSWPTAPSPSHPARGAAPSPSHLPRCASAVQAPYPGGGRHATPVADTDDRARAPRGRERPRDDRAGRAAPDDRRRRRPRHLGVPPARARRDPRRAGRAPAHRGVPAGQVAVVRDLGRRPAPGRCSACTSG